MAQRRSSASAVGRFLSFVVDFSRFSAKGTRRVSLALPQTNKWASNFRGRRRGAASNGSPFRFCGRLRGMLPELTQLLEWFSSGSPRLVAVALLFGLMWSLKNAPYVKGLLTTPRRKQAANALIAMAPAVALIALGDKSNPDDVFSTAILIALSAHGTNTLRRDKSEAPK